MTAVQGESMKTICFPFLCALLVGCTTTRTVTTDKERTIIITKTSVSQYCLQASESIQVSDLPDKQRPGNSSGATDNLHYFKVCAIVGGKTETAEIRTPSGEIATSASLALREEQGSLIATYELKNMLSDGTVDYDSGEIIIK